MARNSFDGGGPSGAVITTSNAGGVGNNQFDFIVKDASATCQFDSGAAHGAYSCQLATAATPGSGCGLRWNTAIGSNTTLYARFYIWVANTPTYPWRIFSAYTPTGGLGSSAIEIQVDGRLSIWDSFSEVLITNKPIIFAQWNRIEIKMVASQTVGQVELRLFNNMDSATPDEILASQPNRFVYSPIGTIDWGHTQNIRGNMGPIWIDDIETSTVGWLGPIKLLYAAAVTMTITPRFTPALTDRRATLTISPTITITSTRIQGTGAILIAMPSLLVVSSSPLQGMTLSLMIQPIYLVVTTPPPLPTFTPPRYPYPVSIYPFRVIVQEILTGKFVDWDLPVQDDFSYTTQLSGPTTMSGAFQSEIASVQQLGLDGYAYFFHVEISGEIRATGIFLPPQNEETTVTFSCEGFSSLPHYITWGGYLSEIGIDPLAVVRLIWADVQNNPRSNLGVIVSSATSNKTLGTPARTEITKNADGTTQANNVEAAPYELLWWEAPNCGETFDNLATQTPFDYRERVSWNSAKDDVDLYVDLGYPRLGTPRDQLLFNEENILEVVPIQEGDDTYASEILVVGAGEGSATVRGYAAEPFGNRVRKVQVITDKTITTVARANAVAASELGLRKGSKFSISELAIHARHQNATIGEYDIGDDIFVQVIVSWLTEPHRAWYRILSITYQPALEIVRLGVARSDSFSYSTDPTDITPNVSDDVLAAQAIMDQMSSSSDDMFEDWTWPGCPPYVGAWNDALIKGYTSSGHTFNWPAGIPDMIIWLQAYIIARI